MQTAKISVLLICEDPKSHRLMLKQLSQMGWTIHAVTSIKKALQLILRKPPTYVFISVNTPALPLLKTIKIIHESFKLPVCLFAEKQDCASMRVIQESQWENAISGNISAAKVRNVIRFHSQNPGLAYQSRTMQKDSLGQVIEIKNLDNIKESSVISVESPDAKVGDSEDIEEHATHMSRVQEGFEYSGKKVRSVLEEALEEADDKQTTSLTEDEIDDMLLLNEGEVGFETESAANEVLNSYDDNGNLLLNKDGLASTYQMNQDMLSSLKRLHEVEPELKDVVEKALGAVVESMPRGPIAAEHVNSLVTIYIKSTKFEGLIYLAVGNNNTIASDLVGPFIKNLTTMALLSQIDVEIYKPLYLTTTDKNIKSWMKTKCDFLLLSSHKDDEVALGYIGFESLLPCFKKAEDNMLSLEVNTVPVQVALNMDLYLYFSVNEKAVKYISKGGYFFNEQKLKLMHRKCTSFRFIDKEILSVKDFFIKFYSHHLLVS